MKGLKYTERTEGSFNFVRPMAGKIYHTNANTSPPTLSFLASLSVTIPWLVERIAIPKPPSTLGSSSLPAYTRRPGFEILLSPVMIFSFLSAPYFNVMRIVLKLPSSTISYFPLYPDKQN